MRHGLLDRMLRLPQGAKPIEVSESADSSSVSDQSLNSDQRMRPIAQAQMRKYQNISLRWPLGAVQITSPYGRRGGDFHEGVDLRAQSGTPVFAAHSGKILYAGTRIKGYGRMIILSHSSGLATVYAHNGKLFVRRGDSVIRGQKIALSGSSGRARGAHLHFEVRMGPRPVNPIAFYEGVRKASNELRSAPSTAGRTRRHRAIASN
ncbi:MAG: M23 family metallopeptidase [Bdellovibrionota bacterium]